MVQTMQTVTAPILTTTDGFPAIRFENATVIIMQSLDYDTYISYSEGGLNIETQRFKISKKSTDYEEPTIIPLARPTTGLLYAASANGANPSTFRLWSL